MAQELLDPISRLALQVFRAQQSLSSAGDALAAQWGMTSAKWKVLGAVDLSESPPSAAAIGRIMGLTRQAATKQVHLLVAQGLLTQRDDPLDARAPVYVLSRKGKSTYEGISAKWAERVEGLSASMDLSAVDTARQALADLVEQLEPSMPTPPLQTTQSPSRKGVRK